MAVTANNPYTLGRGKLVVAKDELVDGQLQWHDFAHILNLVTNVTPEKLEHFNVRGGLKRRDKVITTQISLGGNCLVDLPILDNIKFFFMSDTETAEAQLAGTWTAASITAPATEGQWIKLPKRAVDPDTAIVLTDDPAVTTYTEDTDFEIDYVNGLMRTIPGGTIVASDALLITGAFLADTQTYISAAEIAQQKRHVWFISEPADGIVQHIRGFATLTPSGDLAMIGDDWQQFTLDIDFEDHADYDGPCEYVDAGLQPAA